MPLPKRRLGPARIHHRRSAWMRKTGRKQAVAPCPNCGEPRLVHRVCAQCGQYGGEAVLQIEESGEE